MYAKYAMANYPTRFHGYKVRETNFCLQFENAVVTLRTMKQPLDNLKKTPSGEHYIPVTPIGIGMSLIGVNCPMPIIKDLQANLIKAYGTFYRLHGKTYHELTGESFFSFLRKTQKDLDQLIDTLSRTE